MRRPPHTQTTTEEATLFGAYIIGSTPSHEVIARYKKIVRSPSERLNSKDSAVLSFVHTHPTMLPAIDAYAALFQPYLELRRRLFIMFAILEATPDYSEKFLPKDRGIFYLLTIAGVSLRALFRLLLGIVVMSYIGVRG